MVLSSEGADLKESFHPLKPDKVAQCYINS